MCRNMKAKVLSELGPLQEDGEDLGWKVERSTSYHGKEIRVSEKDLKTAGWQSCWLKIQRAKESKWAQWADASQVESKFQSFPRDHFAPSAPLATHRDPKVSRDPLCYGAHLGSRKVRNWGLRIWHHSWFDSVATEARLWTLRTIAHNMFVFLFWLLLAHLIAIIELDKAR